MFSDDPQLTRRVYKGIPDCLRGEVWSKLLNIPKVKAEQHGVYMVSVSLLSRLYGRSTSFFVLSGLYGRSTSDSVSTVL
jgi:hypothetical protein